MKAVFTGAGSFTGYWIIKRLIEDGNDVYPLFEEGLDSCSGVRGKRIKTFSMETECFFNRPYSKPDFFNFLEGLSQVDVFCHHFFDTKDYKSPDYNILDSLYNSVGDVQRLFCILKKIKCNFFILTGSSFEKGEGAGDPALSAFSPYGLSKTLACDIFSYYSSLNNIKFSKFVIPNPFGVYEEYKFTSYLADSWLGGKIPVIKTPDYIRDNIPVDLLSLAYSNLLSRLGRGENVPKLNPSGYVENNIDFVARMARELSPRLGVKCEFKAEKQTDFLEPISRYNTDKMFAFFPAYDEKKFWDELAKYYYEVFRSKKNEAENK